MTISQIPISTVLPALDTIGAAAPGTSGGAFQAVFQNAINEVGRLQGQADTSVQQFLNGEGGELHEIALASQKAELAFEMFQQVRNKMVQAYQEVMRMQL